MVHPDPTRSDQPPVIVLSLIHKGRTHEVRSEEPRLVLGTKADADVRYTEAGWQAVEATVVHEGSRVRIELPDGTVRRLRVGDEAKLGKARIRLVGLLPLPRKETSVPAPAFGGYEEAAHAPTTTPAPPTPDATRKDVAKTADVPPPLPPSPAAAPVPPAPPTPPRSRKEHPHAFSDSSFGDELVAQLRRAPYFTVSLAAHLLAVLILGMIQAEADQPRGAHEDQRLLATTIDLDEEDLRGEEDGPLDDGATLEEIETPDFPEIEPPQLEPEAGRAKDEEGPLELEPLPLQGGTIMPIGLNPSTQAVHERDRTHRPIPPMDLERSFGKGEEGSVNQRSADYVRARMGRGRGSRGDPFSTLVRSDLLVIRAGWDDIGRVLSSLRLPYTSIPAISLSNADAPDLSQHKVLFWNCGEAFPESRRLITEKRIRAFVKKGGYLFTTDWTIRNIVRGAFPEYLDTTSGGGASTFPETVIGIEPAPGAESNPLLRGVFLPGIRARWWLERSSYDIQVLDRRRVTTLIVSPELETRFGKSPVVAATFRYGKGRVLHVAGHYFQKMGNLAGTIAAHRIALNFVMERLNRDRRSRR